MSETNEAESQRRIASIVVSIIMAFVLGGIFATTLSPAVVNTGIFATVQTAVRSWINPGLEVVTSPDREVQYVEFNSEAPPVLDGKFDFFDVDTDGTLIAWIHLETYYFVGPDDIVELVIGDPNSGVNTWDMDNARWLKIGISSDPRDVWVQVKITRIDGEVQFSENLELTIPAFEEALALYEAQTPTTSP